MRELPKIPRVSPELARSARDRFQPLYQRELTEEDGRRMAENVLGFFAILQEWHANPVTSPTPPPARPGRPRRSTPNKEKRP